MSVMSGSGLGGLGSGINWRELGRRAGEREQMAQGLRLAIGMNGPDYYGAERSRVLGEQDAAASRRSAIDRLMARQREAQARQTAALEKQKQAQEFRAGESALTRGAASTRQGVAEAGRDRRWQPRPPPAPHPPTRESRERESLAREGEYLRAEHEGYDSIEQDDDTPGTDEGAYRDALLTDIKAAPSSAWQARSKAEATAGAREASGKRAEARAKATADAREKAAAFRAEREAKRVAEAAAKAEAARRKAEAAVQRKAIEAAVADNDEAHRRATGKVTKAKTLDLSTGDLSIDQFDKLIQAEKAKELDLIRAERKAAEEAARRGGAPGPGGVGGASPFGGQAPTGGAGGAAPVDVTSPDTHLPFGRPPPERPPNFFPDASRGGKGGMPPPQAGPLLFPRGPANAATEYPNTYDRTWLDNRDPMDLWASGAERARLLDPQSLRGEIMPGGAGGGPGPQPGPGIPRPLPNAEVQVGTAGRQQEDPTRAWDPEGPLASGAALPPDRLDETRDFIGALLNKQEAERERVSTVPPNRENVTRNMAGGLSSSVKVAAERAMAEPLPVKPRPGEAGSEAPGAFADVPVSRPQPQAAGAFVRDETSGREINAENARSANAIAVDRLAAKDPASRQIALNEMRADPEKFKAMGIDVDMILAANWDW